MTPEAYTLDSTKLQWKEYPAPDYNMLNAQYVMDSLEKADIIKNCEFWKLMVK